MFCCNSLKFFSFTLSCTPKLLKLVRDTTDTWYSVPIIKLGVAKENMLGLTVLCGCFGGCCDPPWPWASADRWEDLDEIKLGAANSGSGLPCCIMPIWYLILVMLPSTIKTLNEKNPSYFRITWTYSSQRFCEHCPLSDQHRR